VVERIQAATAILPDYNFSAPSEETQDNNKTEAVEDIRLGTSLSGVFGSLITLILAFALGMAFREKKQVQNDTDLIGSE